MNIDVQEQTQACSSQFVPKVEQTCCNVFAQQCYAYTKSQSVNATRKGEAVVAVTIANKLAQGHPVRWDTQNGGQTGRKPTREKQLAEADHPR